MPTQPLCPATRLPKPESAGCMRVGRFCLPVLETKFVELVSQGPETDAEAFGRTRSVSLSILKRLCRSLPPFPLVTPAEYQAQAALFLIAASGRQRHSDRFSLPP
jgi:hypothetical protein